MNSKVQFYCFTYILFFFGPKYHHFYKYNKKVVKNSKLKNFETLYQVIISVLWNKIIKYTLV